MDFPINPVLDDRNEWTNILQLNSIKILTLIHIYNNNQLPSIGQ